MQAQADAYMAHKGDVRERPWLRKATGIEIRDGFGILGWVAGGEAAAGSHADEKALRVAIGNKPFMQELGVDIAEAERTKWLRGQEDRGRTGLYVALGDTLAALVTIQDPIKPEARGTVARLMQAQVRNPAVPPAVLHTTLVVVLSTNETRRDECCACGVAPPVCSLCILAKP